jgi:PBP1b-binding outer membrane lipoprotein LpoB
MVPLRRIALLLALAVCLAGCASDKPAPPQTGPKGGLKRLITNPGSMNDVRQIAELYVAHETEFNKPPSRPEDLKDDLVKGGAGKIYRAIEDGTYVVVWNVRNPSSQKMLVYEKDADDKGMRWVAMGDGSVKKMNEAEFKQAQSAQ